MLWTLKKYIYPYHKIISLILHILGNFTTYTYWLPPNEQRLQCNDHSWYTIKASFFPLIGSRMLLKLHNGHPQQFEIKISRKNIIYAKVLRMSMIVYIFKPISPGGRVLFAILLSKWIANDFWMGISISKADGFSSWGYYIFNWSQIKKIKTF